ncbi:MAG: hypothetical protein ABIL58_10735 [Pseudomonadota bacterium]
MGNLIIATLAGVVVFSLFIGVLLLRGRRGGRGQAPSSCGRTDGLCQCRRTGAEGPVAFPRTPPSPDSPTGQCPHDSTEGKRLSKTSSHRAR